MPKQEQPQFATTFSQFINQNNHSYGQLAQSSGIPKRTIANWATGKVKQPRYRADVIKLAVALELNNTEATQLLAAAGFPSIDALLAQAEARQDETLLAELARWSIAPPPDATPFQAVGQLPYFVGRQDIITTIETAVQQQTGTRFVLQGMGGIGKTALATQLAYTLRPHFADGVLWARVDTADPMSILNTFAAAYEVDVTPYTDLDGRSRIVRDLLSRKQALIILDNAQSSQQLRPLLPPTLGTCTVIVTTRQAGLSALLGSHTFSLQSFSSHNDEAIRLFIHILGPERTKRETSVLRQIADLLGHLPLALAITAGHLIHTPTRQLLTQLTQQRERLPTLIFDDYNVRLSFQVSYDNLDTAWQEFFNALGIFAGEDFDAEAAAYVADISLSLAQTYLHDLQQRSLVQNGRLDRYRLHPLLRDYAREKLEDTAITIRMINLFTQYAQAHKRDYEALTIEQSNIIAALTEAQTQQQRVALIDGVNAMFAFWLDQGLYTQAEQFLLQADEAAHSHANWQLLARIRHNRALLTFQKTGNLAQSETLLRQGLTYAQRSESQQEMMGIHINLGVLFSRRCRYRQAEEQYATGLELARDLGDERGIGYLLLNLGVMSERQGAYQQAQDYLQEGLALAQSSRHPTRIEGGLLANLGVVAIEQQAYETAETFLHQALQKSTEMGRRDQESNILADLGLLALRQGHLDLAQEQLQQAVTLARELNAPQAIIYTLTRLGWYWLARTTTTKTITTAANIFQETLSLAQKLDSQEYLGLAHFGLAQATFTQQPAEAHQQAITALNILTDIEHKYVTQIQSWLETHY